jgi:hypothetical protein
MLSIYRRSKGGVGEEGKPHMVLENQQQRELPFLTLSCIHT